MSINKCRIGGIISEKPRICYDGFYKRTLRVKLDINRNDLCKFEHITCLIIDKDLITKAQDSIHVGDYFVATGRFVCFEYKKRHTMKCPHCGEVSQRVRCVRKTDIILDDFEVSAGTFLPDSEGINSVVISGVIPYPIKSNSNHTWFSVANNRPEKAQKFLNEFILKEIQSGTERFNPICINGFNEVAESINNNINQKDRIIAKGYIYTYHIRYQIPFRCKYCGEYSNQYIEYSRYDVVAKCVTHDVGYIPKLKNEVISEFYAN